MDITEVISWIGFTCGILIGIPQIIKTQIRKRVDDVSATTFVLIEVTMLSFLVRSLVIDDLLFALYYLLAAIINMYQLYLIWLYRNND